tara:strand:+ start:41 stop:868 length:828 start_codon:yes stop_codon:yes gene_type:complete
MNQETKLTILSLGAGVQSSVMALMAAKGEISPMPDAAIFADTQAEPQGVYDWLDWLEAQLPYPVLKVTAGDLRQDCLDSAVAYQTGQEKKRVAAPPFFTANNAISMRQCTTDYKINPIRKKIRELIGLKPRQRAPKQVVVEQWIGISTDEIQRMKMSRDAYIENRFPLIEMNMTRLHCLEWMRDAGYNELPAKSACTFCPYHSNAAWRDMKENDPKSWEDACEFDMAVREGIGHLRERVFLHRSLVPLKEVDLTDPAKDQITFSFMDECDGMCGV